jgi:hypothetical protein
MHNASTGLSVELMACEEDLIYHIPNCPVPAFTKVMELTQLMPVTSYLSFQWELDYNCIQPGWLYRSNRNNSWLPCSGRHSHTLTTSKCCKIHVSANDQDVPRSKVQPLQQCLWPVRQLPPALPEPSGQPAGTHKINNYVNGVTSNNKTFPWGMSYVTQIWGSPGSTTVLDHRQFICCI